MMKMVQINLKHSKCASDNEVIFLVDEETSSWNKNNGFYLLNLCSNYSSANLTVVKLENKNE